MLVLYNRNSIRVAFPNHPYSTGLDIINPPWFRTALLMAAGHQSINQGFNNKVIEQTSLIHKIEVLKAVKQEVEERDELSDWVASVVSGLVYTDVGIAQILDNL